MNLLKALSEGVKGVLEGTVASVETRNIKCKDGQVRTFVEARVGIPHLCMTFKVKVPEQFIPDCLEGKNVQILPVIKLGDFEKPVLDMVIKGLN